MKNPSLVLALLLLSPVPAAADLTTFKEDVEKAESTHQEEETKAEDSSGRSDDFFSVFVGGLIRILWTADNAYTTYENYPYEDKGFVLWPEWRTDGHGHWFPVPASQRNHWFTASVEGFTLDGLGSGGWITLQGHFYRFLGPYIDAWALTDGQAALSGVRLGGQFALIQSDPVSLSVYGQYQIWSGVLSRQGGTMGLEFRSLPTRPLTLQARLGTQLFEGFVLTEAELQAGWLFGPSELIAGWRWWSLEDNDPNTRYQGPFLGVRTWF